jgi:hypothetical protein
MSVSNARIRPDDELITTPQARLILGGISNSRAYEDPELMSLRLKLGPGDGPQAHVRYIKREVLELRAQRVVRSTASAAAARAQAEKRAAQRRQKRHLRASAIA